MITTEELVKLTKKFVTINSISTTKNEKGEYNENVFAEEIIRSFKKYSLPVTSITTTDGRTCVIVRKKGVTKKTIVLIAHHDTVGVEDYEVGDPFVSDSIAKIVKDDTYLYGRGSGDMKAGIAVAVALMDELQEKELETNVIFMSVPDEENSSAGIIAGVSYLQKLKKEEGLNYIGMINMDCPLQIPGPSNPKTIVAGGAVGKLLPCFYIFGKSAHVSDPFEGIGSNAVASEILNLFDNNSAYSDQSSVTKEVTPPPTCLKSTDLKFEYNVQLPLKSFMYFNYLTYHESPKDVLIKLKDVAKQALEKALEENTKKYKAYMKRQGRKVVQREWTKKIQVFSYEEIEKRARKNNPNIADEINKILKKNKDLDPRDRNLQVVEYVSQQAHVEAPYVVCFFSAPYYPSSYAKDSAFIKNVLSTLTAFGKREHVAFNIMPIADGISDMNYMQIDKKAGKEAALYMTNNPLSQREMEVDLEAIADISMPITDIGPYTLYPHQKDEKVEIEYTFETLPRLLVEIIEGFTKEVK